MAASKSEFFEYSNKQLKVTACNTEQIISTKPKSKNTGTIIKRYVHNHSLPAINPRPKGQLYAVIAEGNIHSAIYRGLKLKISEFGRRIFYHHIQ